MELRLFVPSEMKEVLVWLALCMILASHFIGRAVQWCVVVIRIKVSARRLGLYDRGQVEVASDDSVVCCNFCLTRARIGIDRAPSKGTHRYCWRCENFLDEENEDDPPPGEEKDDSTGTVVHVPVETWSRRRKVA